MGEYARYVPAVKLRGALAPKALQVHQEPQVLPALQERERRVPQEQARRPPHPLSSFRTPSTQWHP